ncbi:phospho-N-acetylmuramoyl-pentapeptide-transferase [Bacteroidota bacterium]
MFYYIFEYLESLDLPGAGLIQYISVRSALALIGSLILSTLFGKRIINYLRKKQVGEEIRDLGLKGQMEKTGTPTMGGLIIIGSLLIPTLLFAKIDNVYIILMLVTTVWLGGIGFLDDYIKVFKKNKKGLAGKFKILGQISLGLFVGLTLFYNDTVVIREKIPNQEQIVEQKQEIDSINEEQLVKYQDVKSTKTTIPFFKNNEFDYESLISWLGENAKKWAWLPFVLIITLIIISVSNGANITDGLDGLATGSAAIMGLTLGILAYVSGNIILSDYLSIMYLPNTGELTVFVSALIGATIGFLWYNSYPAQVFMGDTGSLALGGIIAVFAVIIRKELLIPILCGIFLIENLSVILQVAYFKYTKKRFGAGKRIFLMAPLHHHYQLKKYHESKIVTRFWIIGIILAVLTIVTLKIR